MREHPFIDKPMFITEPVVPSERILGLGSKLYPRNMQRMLKRDLVRFMQFFLSSTPKSRKQKKSSAGRVLFCIFPPSLFCFRPRDASVLHRAFPILMVFSRLMALSTRGYPVGIGPRYSWGLSCCEGFNAAPAKNSIRHACMEAHNTAQHNKEAMEAEFE